MTYLIVTAKIIFFIKIFYILKNPKKLKFYKKRGDVYLQKVLKVITHIFLLFVIVIAFMGIVYMQLNKTTAFDEYNSKASICKVEKLEFTNENWFLEIPKINLKANINYGTTEEVMNEFIGHFDETEVWTGNIGLAAHNRGYPVNYFGRLKELQIGDEIIYTTIYGTKTYKVSISTIIKDTDWSYLQKTNENKLTLITCVENEPNYRRCIQAIEI